MYDPVIVDTFIRVHKDLVLPQQAPAHHEDALARISRAAAPPKVPMVGQPLELPAADSDSMLSIISLARLASEQASAADVATLAATLVRNLVPGVTCAFYIRTEEELVMTHAAGPLSAALRWMRIPVNERLSGWVAAHRRTIVNSDAALDLSGLDLPPVPRTCLSTPLLDGDTLVGVLTLYAEFPVVFTDEQGLVMQMLGPHLALPRPPHVCGRGGRSARDADAALRRRGRASPHRRQAVAQLPIPESVPCSPSQPVGAGVRVWEVARGSRRG